MKSKEQPKLGVPQLWYSEESNVLRLIDTNGHVDYLDMDLELDVSGWTRSFFSDDNQVAAMDRIAEYYHEFVCNIE